jgi:hypothetical protein
MESVRLSIDTRKFVAGRMHPNSWGDKVTVDIGNKDGEALKLNLKDLSIDELKELQTLRKKLEKTQKE